MVEFKFNTFKTPSSVVGANLPKTLFFTFRFYKFRAVQTEKVVLRRPEDIEVGDYSDKPTEYATSYHLVS